MDPRWAPHNPKTTSLSYWINDNTFCCYDHVNEPEALPSRPQPGVRTIVLVKSFRDIAFSLLGGQIDIKTGWRAASKTLTDSFCCWFETLPWWWSTSWRTCPRPGSQKRLWRSSLPNPSTRTPSPVLLGRKKRLFIRRLVISVPLSRL